MDKRTATRIPLQTFRNAFFDDAREITVAPLHKGSDQIATGNLAAVYSDGRLLGLVAWSDLVMLISETHGKNFNFLKIPASSGDSVELPPTVEQLVWNWQDALDAQKESHLSEIAKIESQIAEVQ